MGLDDDCGDEATEGGIVREDPDDVGPALDLAVDPLDRGSSTTLSSSSRSGTEEASRSSSAVVSMEETSGNSVLLLVIASQPRKARLPICTAWAGCDGRRW